MTASAAPSTIPDAQERPLVLCVDADPATIEAVRLVLAPRYEVLEAKHAAAAMEELRVASERLAIVICDLEPSAMRAMRESRRLAPHALHIVLTAAVDPAALTVAINEAGVFRVLTKPCNPERLRDACTAALVARRVRAAEQALAETTVQGAVRALWETLALAEPEAAGRGERVRDLVARLLDQLGRTRSWETEAAALLAHLGALGLPADTSAKLGSDAGLYAAEQALVDRLPATAATVLSHIPSTEGMRQILEGLTPAGRAAAPLGSRVVALALDYDSLVADGAHPAVALGTLRGRALAPDRALLSALAATLGADLERDALIEIPARRLAVGMRLAADVHGRSGSLLIAAGNLVTDQLLERLGNVGGGIREPIQVLVPEMPVEERAEAVGAGT